MLSLWPDVVADWEFGCVNALVFPGVSMGLGAGMHAHKAIDLLSDATIGDHLSKKFCLAGPCYAIAWRASVLV